MSFFNPINIFSLLHTLLLFYNLLFCFIIYFFSFNVKFLFFTGYLPFPSEKNVDYHELSNKQAFNAAFSCLGLRGSKFMYKRAYYEVKSSLQFGRLCTTPTLDNAMDYEETEEEIEIISKFQHLLKKIKKKEDAKNVDVVAGGSSVLSSVDTMPSISQESKESNGANEINQTSQLEGNKENEENDENKGNEILVTGDSQDLQDGQDVQDESLLNETSVELNTADNVHQLLPYDNDGTQVLEHIYVNTEQMSSIITDVRILLLKTLNEEHELRIQKTKKLTKRR